MPEPKLTKDELRQQLTAALVVFHGENHTLRARRGGAG